MVDDPNVAQRDNARPYSMFDVADRAIVGATDGAYHGHLGGAAYGWVTETGEYGFGKLRRARSALGAEIGAVKRFVRVNRRYRNVTLFMDSKDAIRVIMDARDGTVRPGLSLDVINELGKVLEAARHMNLKLEWVRGHDEHPLNDIADRLARLARQTQAFDTGRAVSEEIAENIVAPLRANLKATAANPVEASTVAPLVPAVFDTRVLVGVA